LSQLRAKLTKKPEKDEVLIKESKVTSSEVPKDLVHVQAYIRWEKAGKPNYPPEKQTVAFSTILQIFIILYYLS
jgi:alpha-glucan, water dikinase